MITDVTGTKSANSSHLEGKTPNETGWFREVLCPRMCGSYALEQFRTRAVGDGCARSEKEPEDFLDSGVVPDFDISHF